jgi:CheY-like chemotaxis protein
MAHVLFIDDDPALLELAGHLLTAYGHRATLAIDGRAGIDAYRREPFDLVVTDLFMPVQDGIETIGQIRHAARGTPILAISGRQRPGEYLRAATALGADATLQKPFSSAQLIDAVDRLLAILAGSRAGGSAATVPKA